MGEKGSGARKRARVNREGGGGKEGKVRTRSRLRQPNEGGEIFSRPSSVNSNDTSFEHLIRVGRRIRDVPVREKKTVQIHAPRKKKRRVRASRSNSPVVLYESRIDGSESSKSCQERKSREHRRSCVGGNEGKRRRKRREGMGRGREGSKGRRSRVERASWEER